VLFRILVYHMTGRRAGPDDPEPPRYLLRDETEAGCQRGLRPLLRRVLGITRPHRRKPSRTARARPE
jgi:hypothetical protein